MSFQLRVLAMFLAVVLQVQATIPIGEAGIRVALSDLFLPISIIYTARALIVFPARLRWRIPGVPWWLLAITATLTVSLFVGHARLGHWSSWAAVNKYFGWFALVSYFVTGTALVRFGDRALRDEFVEVFLFTAAGIAAVNLVAFPWLQTQYTLPYGIEFGRATGALQNPNAFGFLLTIAALLVIVRGDRIRLLLPPLLATLWFTASRGAALSFVAGASCYLALSRRLLLPAVKPAGMAALAIVVVSTVLVLLVPQRLIDIQTGHTPLGLFSSERFSPNSATILEREGQNARAIEMFARAPVLGHGLGFFIETTGMALHNSLLWLLLETGLVGTAAVGGFLFSCVYALYRGRDDPFLLGMVAVAVAFMVMSVTGEFLYQRHLWLLLGMALAAPVEKARA
jgi:O-antigen ligase